MIGRRDILKGAAALAAMGCSRAFAQDKPQDKPKARTRVIFLGTKGGPRVTTGRSNPASVLLVNNVPYVIDCGMGVSHQLFAAGVPLTSIKNIFITHMHSDHNLEYGNLVYNAWTSGLQNPIHSYGPKGLIRYSFTFWELNRFDIETRIEDEGRPDLRKMLVAKEVEGDGPVMDDENVKVTAFRTPHPPIVDNFAYKFETPDGTIVFSSDTAFNPKLAEFAKGADVLVHEVMYEPAVDRLVAKNKNAATLKKHLMDSHTTTEDVGRIAAMAGVKVLVLDHLVPGDDPQVTDANWTDGVKKHFNGKIVLAQDLMELTLPV